MNLKAIETAPSPFPSVSTQALSPREERVGRESERGGASILNSQLIVAPKSDAGGSTLNYLHPQCADARGRARGKPRPDRIGRGAEGNGAGLFVFDLGSLVWPPLKLAVGSVTTSAALMLAGMAPMVLPSLIVGNELLILGGVGIAVSGWFLAHRHGHLRGLVAASVSTLGGRASPRAQTSAAPDPSPSSS